MVAFCKVRGWRIRKTARGLTMVSKNGAHLYGAYRQGGAPASHTDLLDGLRAADRALRALQERGRWP